MTKRYLTIPAVVAGALGLSAASAFAADPQPTTADSMQKQIEALQAQVQQLDELRAFVRVPEHIMRQGCARHAKR